MSAFGACKTCSPSANAQRISEGFAGHANATAYTSDVCSSVARNDEAYFEEAGLNEARASHHLEDVAHGRTSARLLTAPTHRAARAADTKSRELCVPRLPRPHIAAK